MNLNTRAWRRLRAQVLIRDLYQCQLQLEGCSGRAEVVDHIRPKQQAGTEELSNLQAACRHCNLQKGPAFFRQGAATEMPLARIPLLRRHFPPNGG